MKDSWMDSSQPPRWPGSEQTEQESENKQDNPRSGNCLINLSLWEFFLFCLYFMYAS